MKLVLDAGSRGGSAVMKIGLSCVFLFATSCSNGVNEEQSSAARGSDNVQAESGDEPAKLEAMLAYEHEVEIRLPGADIAERLQAVKAACDSARFGSCVVLEVNRHAGDQPGGRIKLRAVPTAIDPLIGSASADGEIGRRSTHAEDLAVVVQENTLQRDRLRREHARLIEFQQRGDLAVADMIALSKQLAETEAGLAAAQRDGQQHQRRIDTQLLTISFEPPNSESGRSEIGQAFAEFGAVLSTSAAFMVRAFAALLPLAVVLFFLVIVIRRVRRKSGKR